MPRRNHYTDGYGVLDFEWHAADDPEPPRDRGIVLVETWKPRLSFWELFKPRVLVDARLELWVHRHVTGWHRIQSDGGLEPLAELPKIRRWALPYASRTWEGTVALGGWK
jgi:hypothetical protein